MINELIRNQTKQQPTLTTTDNKWQSTLTTIDNKRQQREPSFVLLLPRHVHTTITPTARQDLRGDNRRSSSERTIVSETRVEYRHPLCAWNFIDFFLFIESIIDK